MHRLQNIKGKVGSQRGFSLIEIMIIVAIIGILVAIALPNFHRARQRARYYTCVASLSKIRAAKEQWAMDNKKNGADEPTDTELFGAGNYIRLKPLCPERGEYTIGKVDEAPFCDATAIPWPHHLDEGIN